MSGLGYDASAVLTNQQKKLSKGHAAAASSLLFFLPLNSVTRLKGNSSLKYKIKQLAKCTKGYSFRVLFYVRENLDACFFLHLQCHNVIVNDITKNINV
jgi:hypothetical protein